MKFVAKVFIILFSLYSSLMGEERIYDILADTNELKPRFGLYGSFGLNFHSTNFSGVSGIPNCCTKFQNAFGTGANVGATFDFPIDYLSAISIRLSYGTIGAAFSEIESTDLMIDGTVQKGKFEHRLNAVSSNLILEPLYSRRLWQSLWGHGGISLALPASTKFSQIEAIIDPADRGVFVEEQTSYRNDTSGVLTGFSGLLIGLSLGVSYELPMTKERWLLLVPSLFFRQYFNNAIDNGNWKITTLDLGLGIKYKTPPVPPPPPPPPISPPFPANLAMPKPLPKLIAKINAVEIDPDGKEKKLSGIKIEDFVSFNMKPLLSYVFFDEGSHQIPSRYIKYDNKSKNNFKYEVLQKLNDIETYYHVLNIIGKRLNQDSSITVSIVGCNANVGVEKNDKVLSRERAFAVRDYLRDVWNVNEKRMRIEIRNLPKEASKSDTSSGQAENRRVEITTKFVELTKPVIAKDTLRQVSKTTIRFLPEVESELEIKDWKVTAVQGNKVIFEKNGSNIPPKSIDWEISSESSDVPNQAGKITFNLEVSDKLSQVAKSPNATMSVEQLTVQKKRYERRKDKEFEFYSLILFDYGKTTLASEHKEVVDFVKSRIIDGSKVMVFGYTDSMGDDAINLRIATQRAKAVADRLNLSDVEYKGIGEAELLFNNELPEGRFYCRTVRINVETEIEK